MSAEPAARGRRLVLLRHGLTPWNAEGRWQGRTDIGLAETGHQQAKAAAALLRAYEPALLVSSDLARTRSTAAHVAEATGLVPSYDPRLREIHVGDFSGLTRPDVIERFGPPPWVYAEHGGETEAAVAGRVLAALRDVATALDAGGTAIVVSHGAALRIGLAAFLGWPEESVASLGALDNCGWIEVEERGAARTDRPWRLAAYNRVATIS